MHVLHYVINIYLCKWSASMAFYTLRFKNSY